MLDVQGVVTYMSPVEAFASRYQDFWLAKSVLDCLISPSEALDRLIFFTGQRSNFSHTFLILDFRSSEVPLIPWLALKKCFDRLILFWSRSQMLLHGTYKWLPLDVQGIVGDKNHSSQALFFFFFLLPTSWAMGQWEWLELVPKYIIVGTNCSHVWL